MHFNMSSEQYSKFKQQTENMNVNMVYDDKTQKVTISDIHNDNPAKTRKAVRSLAKETTNPIPKGKKKQRLILSLVN